MAEKTLWAYLKNGMRPYWEHATRHEDTVSTGIADVSYYLNGNGWIELKEVKVLPKRDSTGITLGQWHKNFGAQRHFLVKRKGFLLIRINAPYREYILLDWEHLPPFELEQRWTYFDLLGNGHVWAGKIDFKRLAKLIDRRVV